MGELSQISVYLPYLIPIVLLELALMIVALVDVIKRPTTRHLSRTVWILLILFFQIVGPIAYLVAGRED